jgi:large subunit ribosomal protein L35
LSSARQRAADFLQVPVIGIETAELARAMALANAASAPRRSCGLDLGKVLLHGLAQTAAKKAAPVPRAGVRVDRSCAFEPMGSYEPCMGSASERAEFTIRSGRCPVGGEAACAARSRQDEGGKALHVSSVGLMRGTQVARRGMPWRLFTLSKRYRTTRFGQRATPAAKQQESQMPKLKTKSGAKKRFKMTGTGKVKAAAQGKRHGMIKRTAKFVRNARGTMVLTDSDAKIVKKYMPYAR